MTINFELKLIELVNAISEEAIRLRKECLNNRIEGKKEDLCIIQTAIADSLSNIILKFQGLEDGK